MSNQLSGKLVNVDAFEVVELLSLEIEDSRAKDDRYVDATAVEYFPVNDWPPLRWPRPGHPGGGNPHLKCSKSDGLFA